jgi:hypothetical protein
VNVFDTQLGCRGPLPLERAFLKNFLSLGTMSIDADTPFEGMDQMIGFVIDEVYRPQVGRKSAHRKVPKAGAWSVPGVERGASSGSLFPLARTRLAGRRQTLDKIAIDEPAPWRYLTSGTCKSGYGSE